MRRKRGFTFIEVMLVMSIFAIVALAVYSTFGAGISVWKRTQDTVRVYQDIRLALDKMTGDLKNTILFAEEYGEKKFINFTGMENVISFYTMVDVFREIPVHPRIKKVTYRLDESKLILERLEQDFAESILEEKELEFDEIAAKISELRFSYCYEDENAEPPYKWEDTWDSTQGIPQGVRIKLKLDSEEDLVFTKYIFLSIGQKGKEEQE